MIEAAILALLITANAALAEWRLRQVRKDVAQVKDVEQEILEKVPGDPWQH